MSSGIFFLFIVLSNEGHAYSKGEKHGIMIMINSRIDPSEKYNVW